MGKKVELAILLAAVVFLVVFFFDIAMDPKRWVVPNAQAAPTFELKTQTICLPGLGERSSIDIKPGNDALYFSYWKFDDPWKSGVYHTERYPYSQLDGSSFSYKNCPRQ